MSSWEQVELQKEKWAQKTSVESENEGDKWNGRKSGLYDVTEAK